VEIEVRFTMKSLLSVAIVAAFVAGCGTRPPSESTEHSWNADYSKWGKDPVADCLIRKRTAIKREYQGSTYYFRDEAEARAFDAQPTAYLAPADSGVIAPDSRATVHLSNVHSR
jgi:YHS domain-containing protein